MNKPVISMLSAQALSILGSAISMIAIPWLLLAAQVSAEKMSLVFAVQSAAAVLAAVLATPFLDRIEKRKIYVCSDVFLALAAFALIFMYSFHWLNFFALAFILASTAIVGEFSSAASSALVPDLLDKDSANHQRVNGLIGTFHNFGDLAGPAIGGLVLTGLGVVGALALDGISFLLSAILIGLCIPKRAHTAAQNAQSQATTDVDEDIDAKGGYWVGVKAIFSVPILRTVTLVSALINMTITPLLILLLPVMVKQDGGSALGLGSMISCFGAGAFLASMYFTIKNATVSPLLGLLGSTFTAALALFLIPIAHISFVYGLLILIGASVGYLGPLEQTLMQRHSPPSQIGRIMLAYSAFRTLFVPLGYFIVGQVLTYLSVASAFISLSLFLTIALLGLLATAKELRRG